MKKFSFCCAFLIYSIIAYNQNVGIGTTTPDNSALLDLISNSKGLLIPRMTKSQRTDIAKPAKGLMVFDTNTNDFWFYYGSAWMNMYTVSSGWSLTGNAGTNPGVNFIGTTDNQPLTFKVNNTRTGYLDGNGNVFCGEESGFSNTTGKNNSAIGKDALKLNTDGNFLVAIGDSALYNNTGATYNTAVGSHSLFFNTTGYNNSANGYQSLYNNTTGFSNTANGTNSLYNNTDGHFNTSNGTYSLYSNTTGSNNTAYGYQSLYNNTTGNSNTANGFFTLYNNTEGNNNTVIGFRSGFDINNGNFNTLIGAYANVRNSNLYNATAIGYDAKVDASDKVRIGNSRVTAIEGQVAFSFPSDARFKYDINNNVPAWILLQN